MSIIILENIRSAYNVWNIIRTADALWYEVRLTWYTPWPTDKRVVKSSLWAENSVNITHFPNTQQAIQQASRLWYTIISAEKTQNSIDIKDFPTKKDGKYAIIVWNEVVGVDEQTLKSSDHILHIHMSGIKSSLNVWQASAIFMRFFLWD